MHHQSARFSGRAAIVLTTLASACYGAPATQPAEPWSTLSPDRWPQLVLTNHATFNGHSPMEGASAFLMRMPDGTTLVGTAKHLIKAAGGVDPPVALADFDHALISWQVYPRMKPTEILEAKGLVERADREDVHDWLLLRPVDAHAMLPATSLTPRDTPVAIGEKVFLVGVPYDDRTSAQRVYPGIVKSRPRMNYFTYEFSPPVHIAGFSGAPIVDARGLLVGHGVSETKGLKRQDGLEVEFGGEDATLAMRLWQHRDDPPTTAPVDAVHLDLSEEWITETPPSPAILKFAEYRPLRAFVELTADARADIGEDVDLMTWATEKKRIAATSSTLLDRTETPLVVGRIAGRPTATFEVTGRVKTVTFHYRFVMLEVNGCFCKLGCYTTPSHWDQAQAKFEEAVESLK